MAPRIEHYSGREQSFIKHLFLNRYLSSSAYKLFQGRSPVFNFIDAFAGPWRVSDEVKYSDASFSQAIETLEAVRLVLGDAGLSGLKVRFRFCERDPDSAEKLQRFANEKSEFDIRVFTGAFEDNLANIRSACSDGFSFTFIDPTGWNIENSKVFAFLRHLNGEFLFNFMAEDVNRHANFPAVADSYGRFLAEPEWKGRFETSTGNSNEAKIFNLLKVRMKEEGIAKYLVDLAIRKPRENRIKMRLILGTNSPHGVEVFRKVQEAVEKDAIQTRHSIRITESGQPYLFSEEQIAELEAEREGVGCPNHRESATQVLLEIVASRPGLPFVTAAVEVMEQVPVRTTHINAIAMNLRKSGLLRFDLQTTKRTPRPQTKLYPAS